MRKPIVIALLTLHLFGNTELPALFRLPNLIQHYFQHHRQNPDLGFFEFLTDHYGGNDGTHADDAEDNKLPMHHQEDTHSLAVAFSPMVMTTPDELLPLVYYPIHHEGRLCNDIFPKHVLTILQPPRFA